jgi:hypothetical protein
VAATPSIKVQKTILFNGVARTWSNRYHFAGGTPADNAHWTTLANNVTAAEKAVISANCSIINVLGYAAGSEIPVFQKSYSLAGTFAGGSFPQATQACGLIRYSTAVRTSRNHPIYLFNYYHDVYATSNGSGRDTVLAAQVTAYSTYANAWIAGFSDGTTTYNRAGPNGASATGVTIEPFITHRDLRK